MDIFHHNGFKVTWRTRRISEAFTDKREEKAEHMKMSTSLFYWTELELTFCWKRILSGHFAACLVHNEKKYFLIWVKNANQQSTNNWCFVRSLWPGFNNKKCVISRVPHLDSIKLKDRGWIWEQRKWWFFSSSASPRLYLASLPSSSQGGQKMPRLEI